jgi:hypothetical protein
MPRINLNVKSGAHCYQVLFSYLVVLLGVQGLARSEGRGGEEEVQSVPVNTSPKVARTVRMKEEEEEEDEKRIKMRGSANEPNGVGGGGARENCGWCAPSPRLTA